MKEKEIQAYQIMRNEIFMYFLTKERNEDFNEGK